jgi:hypothetical protein
MKNSMKHSIFLVLALFGTLSYSTFGQMQPFDQNGVLYYPYRTSSVSVPLTDSSGRLYTGGALVPSATANNSWTGNNTLSGQVTLSGTTTLGATVNAKGTTFAGLGSSMNLTGGSNNGVVFNLPSNQFYITTQNVFGTNDVFFQALCVSSNSYFVIEACDSSAGSVAGIVLNSGQYSGHPKPIIFAQCRSEFARFDINGNLLFKTGAQGQVGGTTATLPSAGEVGYTLSNTGALTGIATGATSYSGTISLPAGHYWLRGAGSFTGSGLTDTLVTLSINTASNSTAAFPNQTAVPGVTLFTGTLTYPVPDRYVVITTTTSYYLTGSPGTISAGTTASLTGYIIAEQAP